MGNRNITKVRHQGIIAFTVIITSLWALVSYGNSDSATKPIVQSQPLANFAITSIDGTPWELNDLAVDEFATIMILDPRDPQLKPFSDSTFQALAKEAPENGYFLFTTPLNSGLELKQIQQTMRQAFARQGRDINRILCFQAWPSFLKEWSVQGIRYFGVDSNKQAHGFGRGFDTFSHQLTSDASQILGWEAQYFQHRLQYAKKLRDLGSKTQITVASDEIIDAGWTGEGLIKQIAVPADIKQYNSLEVRLELDCDDYDCRKGESINQDFKAKLFVCSAEGPPTKDKCQQEIGRWVTPYGQSLDTVSDLSPFLPFFHGEQSPSIRLWTVDRHKVRMTFYFDKKKGDGKKPYKIIPLFKGGKFNVSYGQPRPPVRVDFDDDTAIATIVATTSGHGWGSTRENCAEFCDSQHKFYVNDLEIPYALNRDGRLGCMEKISLGVPPNQNKQNWPWGRGGWCPGTAIAPRVFPLDQATIASGYASISYAGFYNNRPYEPTLTRAPNSRGFAPEIDLASYIVLYR